MDKEPFWVLRLGAVKKRRLLCAALLAVFAAAALPLCRLPRYWKALGKGRLLQRAVFLGAYHLLLPVFCLLSIPLFFQTPLWVARVFVPDVYITVVLSAALLFAAGAIKAIMLFKAKNPSQ